MPIILITVDWSFELIGADFQVNVFFWAWICQKLDKFKHLICTESKKSLTKVNTKDIRKSYCITTEYFARCLFHHFPNFTFFKRFIPNYVTAPNMMKNTFCVAIQELGKGQLKLNPILADSLHFQFYSSVAKEVLFNTLTILQE